MSFEKNGIAETTVNGGQKSASYITIYNCFDFHFKEDGQLFYDLAERRLLVLPVLGSNVFDEMAQILIKYVIPTSLYGNVNFFV